MNDSILLTIKKMLGLEKDYTPFDTEIVVYINAALMELAQMGVGKASYTILDASGMWNEFVDEIEYFEGSKMYVYLKTKTIFDPPSSSAAMQAMNDNISELAWRLNVLAESNRLGSSSSNDDHNGSQHPDGRHGH